eukprot:5738218-Ditylum_brightwellii.AAC.1
MGWVIPTPSWNLLGLLKDLFNCVVVVIDVFFSLYWHSIVSWSTTVALGGNIALVGCVGATCAVVDNVAYSAVSITRPTWSCAPPHNVVGTAAALAYNSIMM